MNQRTFELYNRCVVPATDVDMAGFKFDLFVELIVNDACKVIQDWKDEPFPFDEDLAVRLIRDHFGIDDES